MSKKLSDYTMEELERKAMEYHIPREEKNKKVWVEHAYHKVIASYGYQEDCDSY